MATTAAAAQTQQQQQDDRYNKYFESDKQRDCHRQWQKSFTSHLPIVTKPGEPIFVYEWIDNGNNIFGFGCDANGETRLLATNIRPGVFCATVDRRVTAAMATLWDLDIQCYDYKRFTANNFAPLEALHEPALADQATLCKFVTTTVQERNTLYAAIKRNAQLYQVALVPNYYSTTTQIVFERIRLMAAAAAADPSCNSSSSDNVVGVPKYVHGWFDSDLKHHADRKAPPPLPLITFDIETVSSDNVRIPDGTHPDDVLYSVSIHNVAENVLYTFIYLPLDDGVSHDTLRRLQADGYRVVPEGEQCSADNHVEVFASELAMLKRTIKALQMDRLHLLVGYNSISYDLKFLMCRCAYYRIHADDFYLRHSLALGMHQIHLDLFRIARMRYQMSNYKLNTLSERILNERKSGVDSVCLRHTFRYMFETGQYLETVHSSDTLPSVPDTLHYNNVDTMLVTKLIERTRAIDFAMQRCEALGAGLCQLMSVQGKMHFMVNTECFMVGLTKNCFLGHYQPDMVSVDGLVNGKLITLPYPISQNLMNVRDETTNKKSFPGGANYCHGEYSLTKVQMYDYVVAYPKLIDCANLSYETATIVPASFLLSCYDRIQNVSQWTTFDYVTHKGRSKSETTILFYLYIYENLYAGGRFNFTREELYRRGHSLVILIWSGRPGVLSTIVRHFNSSRVLAKARAKLLGSLIEALETTRAEFKACEEELRALEAADAAAAAAQQQRLERQRQRPQVGGDKRDAVESSSSTGSDIGGDAGTIATAHDDDDDFDFGVDDADSSSNECNGAAGDGHASSRRRNGLTNGRAAGCRPAPLLNDDDADGDDDDDDDDDDFNFGNDSDSDQQQQQQQQQSAMDGVKEAGSNNNGSGDDDNNGDDDDDDDDDFNFGTDVDDGANNTDLANDEDDDFNFGNEPSNGTDEPMDTTTTDGDGGNGNALLPTAEAATDSSDALYTFCGRFVQATEQTFNVNKTELSELDEPTAKIDELLSLVRAEFEMYQNSYLLLKRSISSIYGCLHPTLGALVTSLIRQHLLQTANWTVSLGYRVHYLDTDSVMLVNGDGSNSGANLPNLSAEMNARWPWTEMELKVADRCHFIRKKTYYKEEGGMISYGQHVNGPAVWRNCVNYFYGLKSLTTNRDISEAFEAFFRKCYADIESRPEALLSSVTRNIRVRSEYKTLTTAAKYVQYMEQTYPALAGQLNHQIYYDLGGSVLAPTYRPAIELRSLDSLRKVNLFKYYQNMYATIFNVIKAHMRANNAPFNITLSTTSVLVMMLNAFLSVYSERYPDVCGGNKGPSVTHVTNEDIALHADMGIDGDDNDNEAEKEDDDDDADDDNDDADNNSGRIRDRGGSGNGVGGGGGDMEVEPLEQEDNVILDVATSNCE